MSKSTDTSWEPYLKRLKAFFRKHGHFNVSIKSKADPRLVQWVENIRKHPRRLRADLHRELLAIGFEFNPKKDWNTLFEELVTFYQKHGHSYVPDKKEYETLFAWTINQKHSKQLLSKSQVKQLDSLQFDWETSNYKQYVWGQWYHELVAFREKFGHTLVPENFKDKPGLASWVYRQRKMKKDGKLGKEYEKRLNQLEFNWSVLEERWAQRYSELVKYKKEHGHIDRLTVKKDNYTLGLWIDTQIVHKHLLTSERKRKLDSIGLKLDRGNIYEERWEAMYKRLVEYKKKHGHTRVKKSEEFKLAVWLQRNKKDPNKIDKAKRKKLELLGIKWSNELFQELWQKRFEELKQFKKKHGHIRVDKSNKELYEWIQGQKKLKKENRIPKDREAKLKGIGFIWVGEIDRQKAKLWEAQYERFKKLKKKHGEKYHIQLKQQPELARWFNRQLHDKEKLSAWKKEKLNAINFPWRIAKLYNMELWEQMYKKLKEYKKQHGHCDVPQRYAKNQPLAFWVNGQRTKKLLPEQKAKLNALGFSWAGDISEKRWNERLRELMALKRKDKLHTLKPGMPLYSWLYQQRKNFHKRPEHKKKMLLKLGLDLTGNTLLGGRGSRVSNKSIALWEEKYKRLVAFKKRFGHCAVHGKWQEDPSLGGWVAFQRRLYNTGTLLPERVKKLNELGFDWSR